MPAAKIAVTIDKKLLSELDDAVEARLFPNRSQAVQVALRDKLERLKHARLARECAKLDPNFEKELAEEGMAEDSAQWPEF